MKLTIAHSPTRNLLAVVLVLAVVMFAGWLYLKDNSSAADTRNFDPGNIMSDAVMSNKSTMSVQDIQNFLNSKNYCDNRDVHMATWYPHLQYNIKDGRFVCMARDSFNGKSAAQIIWQVAQDYSVNPQFLIVLLEKEQGLVTDTWPNHVQYRTATGFGCPDTAPCDSQYFGLENQLRQAANLFRTVLNGGWSNYPVGNTYVQYHPNVACGGSVINIQNRATSALYRYTPYQPNQSALNAGYGTGDSCGAYGNRNTWRLFTDWFGSTTSGSYIDIQAATKDMSKTANDTSLGVGSPSGNIHLEYDSAPRAWQNFTNGTIIWTTDHGAKFIPYSTTYTRWRQLGGSLGSLGVPTTNAQRERDDGRVWQNFSKGTIIYTEQNGGWEVVFGPLGDKWRQLGGSLGSLGKPISSVTVESNGNRRQAFEKGIVIRKDLRSPAHDILYGPIYDVWDSSLGSLGVPTTSQKTESDGRSWQNFEKGTIISTATSGIWSIHGSFNVVWRETGGSLGSLGVPTTSQKTESDGRSWQNFEKGVLVQSSSSDSTYPVLFGPINNRWRETGGSLGSLGVPTTSQKTETDGRSWQDFEKGTIIESPLTGAWEVEGNFYGYWKEHGGSLGLLGKPTGAKLIEDNGTRWQSFEKGKIVWNPQNGWSIDKA